MITKKTFYASALLIVSKSHSYKNMNTLKEPKTWVGAIAAYLYVRSKEDTTILVLPARKRLHRFHTLDA